jgi:hypothetical protein
MDRVWWWATHPSARGGYYKAFRRWWLAHGIHLFVQGSSRSTILNHRSADHGVNWSTLGASHLSTHKRFLQSSLNYAVMKRGHCVCTFSMCFKEKMCRKFLKWNVSCTSLSLNVDTQCVEWGYWVIIHAFEIFFGGLILRKQKSVMN